MERKKFHDPLIDLQRQMSKLIYGKPVGKFADVFDRVTGEWSFVNNRYGAGNRIYQMQVDFMYMLKTARDSGRNTGDIRKAQDFIDTCKIELGL